MKHRYWYYYVALLRAAGLSRLEACKALMGGITPDTPGERTPEAQATGEEVEAGMALHSIYRMPPSEVMHLLSEVGIAGTMFTRFP
jgi:hypothetical protein